MVDWTEKYRPSSLSEVRGNNKARDALAEWAKSWDDHREAVVVYGSPGIGKTSAAHALASDMGWETVELNASDQRTGDVIERFAGRAAKNATLSGSSTGTSTRQLVILDEADNIHGNYDRGGSSAVTKLVKSSSQPIVLIANEFYDMSRGLRNACQEIEFRDVSARSIVPVLRDICRKEGLEFESDALQAIADMNSGDLRSAVNDLQAIAEGRDKITEEDVIMGDRDRSVGLFEFLDAVLKEESAQEALYTAYDVDETPDDLTKWVEDKVSLVYEPDELARAYEFLANADRWLGRVRASQNYSYWRYATDNLAAGVAASRDRTRGGWTRYGGAPYRSTRDKTRDTVVRKIAEKGGFSMSTARREVLPYLSAVTHHCKPRELTVAMTAYYDFDTSHVSFVTGSGETTNKVQSIVEDAEELREELVEEHAGGAFAGMEDVSIDGENGGETDAATDGDDDVLNRDDESAASDEAEASTDDGQSGLSDFF
ncbi:replication factor C large subunit [Haloferax mediterranei ATCC 33500]|uniref:Replication factor C large subunit n=1 Tax=Haloferax mediterranei (strain ATCC 33500 / DSM 1411 / JCM 8866 / NBRC 14739 / NCIMB 2177 / R-4) TaxID=523841 RepID=I3R7B2_HALMT|nr:replication factor C large subunit [Haloferax mediterranei]AFK20122.1 replication factor C large subunit [Haloferax mediterranei ATCC 33500]AHZ23494.1 ATPase AAA [Haloferax mediterranei ATCC 33500]ELZ99668.1 replication factor C large subunit [Haloferax mediterranei ATCC 33500]MDX5987128.1 replication factor C large subunit [Haloferax mediterranei ATCC 33500]QCQ76441.1 replication factor C large subunit [Haloferax mediterranei ATCC 33500]